MMRRAFLAGWLALALAPAAWAQSTERLEARVSSVAGRSVFLDRGRRHGVQAGTVVRFVPAAGAPIEGTVRQVTAGSARVEIAAGEAVPAAGTLGEMFVAPSAAGGDGTLPRAPDAATPAHPPWSLEESGRAADLPLLAPAGGRAPADRPVGVRGRLHALGRTTVDTGENRDAAYAFGRLGASMECTNLFGHAGRLAFEGDLDYSAADSRNLDRAAVTGRINRLAYAVGLEHDAPYQVEGGRFVPSILPELGLFDGVEGTVKLQNGLRAGAGAGVYLAADPRREWGRDMGFHLFTDYAVGDRHEVSGVLGFQQTWHDGNPDRDQILARLNVSPLSSLWFSGTARLDYYSATDRTKDEGFEATELFAQARFAPAAVFGASVSASQRRWPDVRSTEVAGVAATTLAHGRVDRYGASVWSRPHDQVYVFARYDAWSDRVDRGTNGSARAEFGGATDYWPALKLGGFFTNATFTDTIGGRAGLRRTHRGADGVDWHVEYEISSYERVDLSAADDDRLRHRVEAGVAWSLGRWYAAVRGTYLTGDGEEGYTAEISTEYRF